MKTLFKTLLFKFYCRNDSFKNIDKMLSENLDFKNLNFSIDNKNYNLLEYLYLFKNFKKVNDLIKRIINEDRIGINNQYNLSVFF